MSRSRKPTNKVLYDYCKKNIEDFSERESIAWGIMDRQRCSLAMAEPSLYYEMNNCIEDYCIDNELNAEDYDTEEVFFHHDK
jgi:hypothetical protein